MNTHPNTPFGKFFAKIGLWHPHFEGGIVGIYDQLAEAEQLAIADASGWVAVINANVQAAPDFVFELIASKFPGATKEKVTEVINKVNAALHLVEDNTPATFEDAVAALQAYLSKYEGNTWIAITKAVVAIAANILTAGTVSMETIYSVLDLVYHAIVKPKVN
jgi:hypothetical protein